MDNNQTTDNRSFIVKEIHTNYNESFDFIYERKKRQVRQLVLLNNLQRGDENIASTMLITLFNRILSNLYDDKIQVKFVPSEEVDQKKINSLNLLAQNDYREMEKDKLDYDWAWDTLFFGNGWVETINFDKKRKLLKPTVINPLAFGYDPYFDEVQDWRYYWKWVTKSKWQLKKLIDTNVITGVKTVDQIPSGVDDYLWDFKVKIDQAKKGTANAADPSKGDVYQILEYYGYNEKGEKSVFWIDRGFSQVLMEEKLEMDYWPIVKKEAFKMPHSSIPFSIADLLEDKHRAKSVLLNLSYLAAKDKANPLYQYNPDLVNDVTSLFNRQINQHISVKDTTGLAIAPLNTSDPMSSGLSQFMQMLQQEANDPVGTGMSIAPAKKGKQSATETAIQQQLNDLAQSLQSKVMQFGEKEFWEQWYEMYVLNSKAGDEKIATITGVKGMSFEKIDLGEIKTTLPPGVMVYSAKEAEYKELVLRRDLMQMYPQFTDVLGTDGMRNFNKYVFFPKMLNDPSLIDLLIPNSLDEIKAEGENELLNVDKMPDVSEIDDHQQHLYVHQMAKKTWATWTHMAWHEALLGIQKKQQQQAQQAQAQQQQGQPPQDTSKQSAGGGDNGDKGGKQKPQVDTKKQNPLSAVAPLQQAAQPSKMKV